MMENHSEQPVVPKVTVHRSGVKDDTEFTKDKIKQKYDTFINGSTRRFWLTVFMVFTFGLALRTRVIEQGKIGAIIDENGDWILLPPGRHDILPWEKWGTGRNLHTDKNQTQTERDTFDLATDQCIQLGPYTILTVWQNNVWKVMYQGMMHIFEGGAYLLEGYTADYQISTKTLTDDTLKEIDAETSNHSPLKIATTIEYRVTEPEKLLLNINSLNVTSMSSRTDSNSLNSSNQSPDNSSRSPNSSAALEHFVRAHAKTVISSVYKRYSSSDIAGCEQSDKKEFIQKSPENHAAFQKKLMSEIHKELDKELQTLGITLVSCDITSVKLTDPTDQDTLVKSHIKKNALLAQAALDKLTAANEQAKLDSSIDKATKEKELEEEKNNKEASKIKKLAEANAESYRMNANVEIEKQQKQLELKIEELQKTNDAEVEKQRKLLGLKIEELQKTNDAHNKVIENELLIYAKNDQDIVRRYLQIKQMDNLKGLRTLSIFGGNGGATQPVAQQVLQQFVEPTVVESPAENEGRVVNTSRP